MSTRSRTVNRCNGLNRSSAGQRGSHPVSFDRSHGEEGAASHGFDPNLLLPKLEDVLCLFLSSVVPDDFLPTDFVLLPEHPSFPATGWRQRSVFRRHKLALRHRSLIVRIFGESDGRLLAEVNPRLYLTLGL